MFNSRIFGFTYILFQSEIIIEQHPRYLVSVCISTFIHLDGIVSIHFCLQILSVLVVCVTQMDTVFVFSKFDRSVPLTSALVQHIQQIPSLTTFIQFFCFFLNIVQNRYICINFITFKKWSVMTKKKLREMKILKIGYNSLMTKKKQFL